MVLDLRELIGGSVGTVPFAYEESASDLSDDLVSGSVSVDGVVENHAGYLTLDGMAVLEGIVR